MAKVTVELPSSGEKIEVRTLGVFELDTFDPDPIGMFTFTGKTLADVYQERILQPLGMTLAYLPQMDAGFDPAGYTNLFGLLDEKVPYKELVSSVNCLNSSGWSAGGLITTAHELGSSYILTVSNIEDMAGNKVVSGSSKNYRTPDPPEDPGEKL